MSSRYFTIGFTGATTDEAEDWSVQVVQGDTVVLPMTGSGKDIAAFARKGRTIYSWDTQPLSALAVDLFASKPTDRLAFGRADRVYGFASSHHPISGMPSDAEGLADAVMLRGSALDRIAMASALLKCLFFRNRALWSRGVTVDDLFMAYRAKRNDLARWQSLPGKFKHVIGSCFDDPSLADRAKGATVYIDPPKVLSKGAKGDIYSGAWEPLNSIIAQRKVTLPGWSEADYRDLIPRLWQLPWKRLIQFHATGILPSVPEMERMFLVAGLDPEDAVVSRFAHKAKIDVAWLFDR